MLTYVVLAMLTLAPAAADKDTKEPPPKLELFAKEDWYKERKEKEQDFVGTLKKAPERGIGFGRFNPYRLEMTIDGKEQVREVYIGGKPALLAPYADKKIKLIGKPVDLEVEGQTHKEIWPARLEVVAGDPKDGKKDGAKDKDDKVQEAKILASGSWRPSARDQKAKPQQHVIKSAEELVTAAGQDNAKDEAKQKQLTEQVCKALKVDGIDWKKQMLVVVTAGSKPTGGYSVEITKIEVKDKTMTVKWKVNSPKPDQPVTQAFTHPALAVVIDRFDGDVKFDPPAGK